MPNDALLEAVTDVLSKEADILLAVVNLYGLVIVAAIGWIVNTGKDGPGVSWFRVCLFNLGFVAFMAAVFAGLWYVYERLEATAALWSELAARAGGSQARLEDIAWFPPRDWLWGLWGFNAIILVLASVLLRRGGYGRS